MWSPVLVGLWGPVVCSVWGTLWVILLPLKQVIWEMDLCAFFWAGLTFQCCSFLCCVNSEELSKGWTHCYRLHSSTKQWGFWALWQSDPSLGWTACLFWWSSSCKGGEQQQKQNVIVSSLFFFVGSLVLWWYIILFSYACHPINVSVASVTASLWKPNKQTNWIDCDWMGWWVNFAAFCSCWVPLPSSA